MSQQAPAPSIPSSPTPGKDPPPPLQPGATLSGSHEEEEQSKTNTDAKSMPPPPMPNPRRTSYQEGSRRSPGILLTHPTFTSATHTAQGNTPESFAGVGEGTDGTVTAPAGPTTPRPHFAPFFTLVNDLGSGTGDADKPKTKTAHPRNVHYIFADDDETGLLTDALVRSTQADGNGGREGQREERVVIVDINDAGDGVRSVWSANPGWAVVSAEIGNAPTWDGEREDEAESAMQGKGMMLRIEGVSTASATEEGREYAAAAGKRDAAGSGQLGGSDTRSELGSGVLVLGDEEMQGLLEGFDRKMAVLRRVAGAVAGEDARKNSETEG